MKTIKNYKETNKTIYDKIIDSFNELQNEIDAVEFSLDGMKERRTEILNLMNENDVNICDGKIQHHSTPDDIDVYICKNCGKQYYFDFDMPQKCQRILTKTLFV